MCQTHRHSGSQSSAAMPRAQQSHRPEPAAAAPALKDHQMPPTPKLPPPTLQKPAGTAVTTPTLSARPAPTLPLRPAPQSTPKPQVPPPPVLQTRFQPPPPRTTALAAATLPPAVKPAPAPQPPAKPAAPATAEKRLIPPGTLYVVRQKLGEYVREEARWERSRGYEEFKLRVIQDLHGRLFGSCPKKDALAGQRGLEAIQKIRAVLEENWKTEIARGGLVLPKFLK